MKRGCKNPLFLRKVLCNVETNSAKRIREKPKWLT